MIQQILNDPAASYLVAEQGKNKHIIIGVPHHAPFGNPRLPTVDARPADENAGYLGLEIARLLECSCVIACNYSFDVNKYWTSDYSRIIKQWQPQILIEIHGHGGNSAFYDIEITTGGLERNDLSKFLAHNLMLAVSDHAELSELSISGDFPEIYFQASMTKTINTSRWQALHIELPIQIRKPAAGQDNNPSPLAYEFCSKLTVALRKTLQSYNIEIK